MTDESPADARERLDAVLDGVDRLEMTRPIKQRAMDPFPVNVRTLDALHIATALMVADAADGLSLFSHDRGMNLCARSLGLSVALA